MTTSASALPALAPNDEGRKVVERINVLVRWFNRPDLFVPSYAADTGSGTAYVTSPSTDVKVYEIGQEFDFKATNANTSTAPTLAVNGLAAGTITKAGGAALVLGDIAANGFYKVIVTSTTPTFQLLSPAAAFGSAGATTFLGADVATPTANAFVAGPNTGSIGANGQTWLISAAITYLNSDASAHSFTGRIFDGTNSIANSSMGLNAGFTGTMFLAKVVTLTGATTFTAGATDNAGGSVGAMKTSALTGTANQATSIIAVRLA